MAWSEHYVTATGTDTYANSTNIATPCSLATAIAGAAAGDRVNIKAGTYANTTTSRTFGTTGTATAPVWWRGYNTTIGDIDADNTLAKPAITFTTGQFIVSANYQGFSNLDVQSQATAVGGAVNVTAAGHHLGIWFDRVRVENTAANANSCALNVVNSGAPTFQRCWFKATATASFVVSTASASGTPAMVWQDCTFAGGGSGLGLGGTGANSRGYDVLDCVFNDNGTHGIDDPSTIAYLTVSGCSFYSPGTDGIRLSGTRTNGFVSVTKSIFSQCGGYGINNNTGTNNALTRRYGNLFFSNTSGNENGLGDTPSRSELTDPASPFVSATDFTPAVGSGARSTAGAGGFENTTFTSYGDRGAVRHPDPPRPDSLVIAPAASY